MEETTTIKMSKSFKDKLKELGTFGQSYEDIIKMLYDEYFRKK